MKERNMSHTSKFWLIKPHHGTTQLQCSFQSTECIQKEKSKKEHGSYFEVSAYQASSVTLTISTSGMKYYCDTESNSRHVISLICFNHEA